ncbi:MAG TPA: beta/gamma crystallin-related protein [Pyrinomonadaceae bacterium]|nr:beta/gamma crystallin-related protein [Pyrinomonadaceae bacterium]
MAKIIAFAKQNFEGNNTLVSTENVPNLKPSGLNNDISSIIVISGTWVLFEHINYEGNSWTVSNSGGSTEDGCYPTYSGYWPNNSIGSFKIQGT